MCLVDVHIYFLYSAKCLHQRHIHSFIHLFVHSLVHSFIYSFICLFVLFVHLLDCSFICLFNHSIRFFIYLFIHSFIYLFHSFSSRTFIKPSISKLTLIIIFLMSSSDINNHYVPLTTMYLNYFTFSYI